MTSPDLPVKRQKTYKWHLGALILIAAVAATYTFRPNDLPEARHQSDKVSMLQGRVVGVMDGDTLDLIDTDEHTIRVRLSYVDAPEFTQPYGPLARQNLARLVIGKQVMVRVHGKDKFDRLLGEVSHNGQDVSETQLQQGLAWHYLYYARKEQSAGQFERYQQLEQTARQHNVGLWRDPKAEAPWDFRRQVHG
ncbi:thermonuclease family protein [Chitinimonas sp. PSY-7]|uniref:thermonuclease family protein n=1 Tax=Chitinimonas sp. PSY-7 TaxID=3459088 RepID=UPI00403FCD43